MLKIKSRKQKGDNMEKEFLLNLKSISLEIFVVAFIVFALTSILKLPIKKLTSKLEENRRKAINTIIVFIPMLLSGLLTTLYFGIMKHDWLSNLAFETSISVYVLSISIYAIMSKIILLIKGIKTGEIKTDSKSTQEVITSIKSDISSLTNILNIDKTQLENVKTKIEKLSSLKETVLDSEPLKEITLQLNELLTQKNKLENKILITQNQIYKKN